MMQPGAQGFVDDTTEIGLCPRVEAELVICRFTLATGARAGTTVEVGVALEELQFWPQAPPYWVHLPDSIRFSENGSIKDSPKEGWMKHSRQINGWGNAPPAIDWSSHIQRVLKVANP